MPFLTVLGLPDSLFTTVLPVASNPMIVGSSSRAGTGLPPTNTMSPTPTSVEAVALIPATVGFASFAPIIFFAAAGFGAIFVRTKCSASVVLRALAAMLSVDLWIA